MLRSMTAFARQQISTRSGSFAWEIRSVNHRYLELSIKLPDNLRQLEPIIRSKTRNVLQRGKIECALRYDAEQNQDPPIQLNIPFLTQLAHACEQVNRLLINPAPINAVDLLRWPGALHNSAESLVDSQSDLLTAFDAALLHLQQIRAQEGQTLGDLISNRLTTLSQLTQQIQNYLPNIEQQQRTRLLTRARELQTTLDSSRVEQEILLLLQKSDITEEVDRLFSHIQQAHTCLREGGSIGRHLDFLMQELNREANTLGAKASDELLSKTSVEMKVLIEQMREQIQNLE